MSLDYADIALDVIDVMKEVGVQMMLKSANGADVYDPVTGVVTPSDPGAETPFNGVRLNIDSKYAQKVGTQNIQLQDELVYMEPGRAVPTMQDEVDFGKGWWSVVRVEEYAPANVPVLYIMQVRP